MSGQMSLTKEEEDSIKAILQEHGIDYFYSEVSIHVSGYDDCDEKIVEDIYIQED